MAIADEQDQTASKMRNVMNNLQGKVILITGATAGIGRAIAMQAVAKGARLALCGRSDIKMQKLRADLSKYQHVYTAFFDITNESLTMAFIADAINHFGKIDILINNAGANTAKNNIVDIQTADYEYMIKLNQVAPFVVMREVFKDMQQRKAGHIVNILSSVCKFSNPSMGAYTGSKDGFEGMTKVFRKEAAEDNVVVTAVYPGGVDTDFRAMERSDYLSAYTVAQAIISMLELPAEAAVHELLLRPHVERNY